MQTSSYVRTVRTFSRSVCTPNRSLHSTSRCNFSSSSSRADEGTGGEDGALKKNPRAKVDPQTVEDWFKGEGLPYLNPTPGKPNWLGGDIPFPDNPTFRPPPPLSDVVKSSIYDQYVIAPRTPGLPKSQSHEHAIRALSERFGISISRVEAIIRLKHYEQQYQKVNYCLACLQTGKKIQHAFQQGMESYLGIRQERDRAVVSDNLIKPSDINFARQRTSEVDRETSDSGERAQKAGAARRVWWEMIDDAPDAQPVVPGLITEGLKEHRTKLAEDRQAHAGVALHVEGRSSPQGKSRSVFTFINTGAKGLSSQKKVPT